MIVNSKSLAAIAQLDLNSKIAVFFGADNFASKFLAREEFWEYSGTYTEKTMPSMAFYLLLCKSERSLNFMGGRE